MRGTVLVLALLLTAELRIQPVEACVIFYDVFTRVILGSKEPLFDVLAKVNATEGEKAAFQKIQQCFNEGGLKAKIVDTFAMLKITFSKECLSENPNDALGDIAKIPEYVISLLNNY